MFAACCLLFVGFRLLFGLCVRLVCAVRVFVVDCV